MFEVGDRVRVNYGGSDAAELREKGLDIAFNGTVYAVNRLIGAYRVTADTGQTPFDDDDPTWYVFEPELEPLAA